MLKVKQDKKNNKLVSTRLQDLSTTEAFVHNW